MSPPALVIAGSIVIVAVGTVAFHQFVYEPHIAPKLEVIFENWKEKRRLRRRHLAPAVYADHDDELSFSASGPRDDKSDLEMKDISLPLRISGIDAGLSEATLRKRPHKGELDASTRPRASEPSFVIASLLPAGKHELASASRSSTPSTFSSSILATQSPLINPVVSPLIDPSQNSDLADSILNSPNDLSFAVLSPAHSITHISPRAPVILMPPVANSISIPIESTDSEDEEDNRPLAAFSPRREQSINYPVLAPSIQVARSSSSLSSPTGGTVYESFAPSPVAPLSPSAPAQLLLHEQDALPLPRSNSFLSPGQRTPQSTTSWSDAGMSEDDDEPDVLVGSDVESWANVSDVSHGSRRLRI